MSLLIAVLARCDYETALTKHAECAQEYTIGYDGVLYAT